MLKSTAEKADDSDEEESDEDSDDSSGQEEMDEDAIARRRDLMRQRALARAQMGDVQEEMMQKEDEKSGPESGDETDESSEEETDSDEEEGGARLKPVFVRAKDRITIQEREREEAKARQAEKEAARAAEDRRRQTLRLVEEEVRRTTMAERANKDDILGLEDVNTDDENDELEYEAWKVRELKRLKRDRDEREAHIRELAEMERFRNLSEDQKRQELRQNPKTITNKSVKGKYKFMQKYYHRGAFYLNEENNLLKQDFTAPTLEDKFDKSVLPKVMQVKNFGRSGRTKYTHLVDQDTTEVKRISSLILDFTLVFLTSYF